MTADPIRRPVSARSALLSLLLGAHPPTLPARELLAMAELVGVSEPTARVALSRMVATGDVRREDGAYTLNQRLLARQRRQDAAVDPATRPWHGGWELLVVTATGRGATARAAMRTELGELRFGELREGVWMRPDNLVRPCPESVSAVTRRLATAPVPDAAELAGQLWDLPGWATDGHTLLRILESTEEPATRFAAIAMSVRHLLTDPVLPAELLPADWPGTRLRAEYQTYREWLISMRPAVATRD
ncbi:MAG: PaaX family transcriptional regulator C-terminal domain-containing protein [Micromonosporaceae bacterium]